MNVDKKTFAIGVLSLSSVVLVAANMLAPRGVSAADSIKDNDYQLQTARMQQGGEALYVTDNRSGNMAVFAYNPNRKALEVIAVRPVMDAFAGAGGAPVRPGRTGARP